MAYYHSTLKAPSLVASEATEQMNLMSWWSLASNAMGIDERLLFSIPNEGCQSRRVGARLKATGRRAGVPDLMLAIPVGKFHGLFIEMKRVKGGVVSDKQFAFHKILRDNGYAVIVSKGADSARHSIVKYLSGDFSEVL